MKRIVNILLVLSLILTLALSVCGCSFVALDDEDFTNNETKPDSESNNNNTSNNTPPSNETVSLDNIPNFTTEPYVTVNDGKPFFTAADMTANSYESYSELDSLGRCGVVIACIGKDIMPTEDRGSIGTVKPSGWHTVKYDIVDGKYLYNRCHLIGFQLTGENANKKNLITAARDI